MPSSTNPLGFIASTGTVAMTAGVLVPLTAVSGALSGGAFVANFTITHADTGEFQLVIAGFVFPISLADSAESGWHFIGAGGSTDGIVKAIALPSAPYTLQFLPRITATITATIRAVPFNTAIP